jgi:hypothetical protein
MSRYKRSNIDWKDAGNFGRYLRLTGACRRGKSDHGGNKSFAEAWAGASPADRLWFLVHIGALGPNPPSLLRAQASLLEAHEVKLPPPAVLRAFRRYRNENTW